MNLGTAETFEAGATQYPVITYLDDTHFVIAYQDVDDSTWGKCIAGSISVTTITLGSAVKFSLGAVGISIDRLDSTHFVIAYRESQASDKGACVVGSVSGTAITIGTPAAFETEEAYDIDVCGMDATHFVIAYRYSGYGVYQGKVIGASVSGTTITVGASDIFESDTYRAIYISICSLDSSHFVVAYKRIGDPAYGTVACGTLSGNTVTIVEGGGTTFITHAAEDNSIAALDSTHFIIAFRDGNTANGAVIAGSVSGTTITITADSATTFETGPVDYYSKRISIACPSSSQFLIAFVDNGDSYKGKVIEGTVSGVAITVTADSATTFETGSCGTLLQQTIGICAMGLYFGIAFVDADDSSKGKVIIGGLGIKAGDVSISSVSSISADTYIRRGGVASISSVSSLYPAGNFYTLGNVDISSIPSVSAIGAATKQGVAAILSVSGLIAIWQTRGICYIKSTPSMSANGVRTASGVTQLSIASSMLLTGQRIANGEADIDVVSSMLPNGDRHRIGVVSITAVSAAEIVGLSYLTQSMGYTGNLTAGDVLVIDCDEQTVELNGVNSTKYFTGEFPQLYAGTNELRYEDGGEVPDLTFKTTHDPRYL